MNVCLIFSGIAKLLCKCMVTRGVNLSKIWSKNYLYDHFNQRLHIHQTSQCYFTQLLIFHCPVPFQSPSHSSQSLSYYLLQLVISGKAIPTFFSFSVECVSWYWVGGSDWKKKKLKTKYHKKSRNRRPWYPRMTLKLTFTIWMNKMHNMWKVWTQESFQ